MSTRATRALAIAAGASLAAVPVLVTDGVAGAAPTTLEFDRTEAPQEWTVPTDVQCATFTLWGALGAQGGDFGANETGGNPTPQAVQPGGPGAAGGKVVATLPVTPGTTYTISIGRYGTAGSELLPKPGTGGPGNFDDADGGAGGDGEGAGGGGGGGSTDIRVGGTALANRILVAGGGGGGGAGGPSGAGGAGGAGGEPAVAGIDGALVPVDAKGGGEAAGGGAGTATAPGAGGTVNGVDGYVPAPSELGADGSGANGGDGGSAGDGGGGGGGGWFGGGGGGGGYSTSGAGGGGGSSYVSPSIGALNVSFVTGENPVRDGNGLVSISFTAGDNSCRPQPTTTTTSVQTAAVVATPKFTG